VVLVSSLAMSSAEEKELPAVPPELVEAGATGHLVVLVGAGASLAAGLPGWKELLKLLVARAQNEAATDQQREELKEIQQEKWIEENRLLETASYLRQEKGAAWIAGAIAAEFHSKQAQPSPIHRALAELPGAAFITTNYDSLLEQALEERRRPGRVVLASEVEGIRDLSAGQVLKLHGDLKRGEIVLSVEDYFQVSHKTPGAWKERLKFFLQGNHRLLLVGYSYSDPDIQDVVDKIRDAYEEKNHRPFWLTTKNLQIKTRASAYGLEPIWLADYKQTVPWLQQLVKAIEARKARVPALIAATEVLQQVFRQEQEQAHELFEQQQFEEAQAAFQKILQKAERLAGQDDNEFASLATACRLNIACCLLCLQKGSDALLLFQEVARREAGLLNANGRAVLSEGLAQLGDLERARAVLPATDESPRVRQARLLLQLLEGNLPEGEPLDSAPLAFHHAQGLLSQNRLDEAARAALALHKRAEEDDDKLLDLLALGIMVEALRDSVLENPRTSHWVPLPERAALVEAIEQGVARLDAVALPRSLQEQKARAKLIYYSLARDKEGLLAAEEEMESAQQELRQRPEGNATQRGGELDVQAGATEPPLWLSSPEHPWLSALGKALQGGGARSQEQILRDVLELAARMPGRGPIEYEAARRLWMVGRPEEALPHARAAFEALPAREPRLMLAECMLMVGQTKDALEVLTPIEGSEHPRVLSARALALEPSSSTQAVEIWKRYLEVQPDDLKVRLRLPYLLFDKGDHVGAVGTAWEAFSKGRDSYDPQELYQCAQFQMLLRPFDEMARSRVREIVRTLELRFPGTPQAEQYRLRLLTALGDTSTVDFESLAQAGVLHRITTDELLETIRSQQQLQELAYQRYQLGQLSFDAYCKITRTPPASLIMDIVQSSRQHGRLFLTPPLGSADALPIPGLAGQRLLTGELELLLLQHLGLLEKFRQGLGHGGCLLVFQDVWHELTQAAGTLGQKSRRVELERLERLFDFIDEHRDKISMAEQHQASSDMEWARAQGLTLIDQRVPEGGAGWLSARVLVVSLSAAGRLERGQRERLERLLPAEDELKPDVSVTLPEQVAIAAWPLRAFFEAGAMSALLDAVRGKLWLGPEATSVLRRQREELRLGIQAAELAMATHRVIAAGRTEGWVKELPRPPSPPLSEVPEHEGAVGVRLLVRDPLLDALAYHQALASDPQLCWLSADAFSVAPAVGLLTRPRELAWMSWQDRRNLSELPHTAFGRVIRIPVLVRLLRTLKPAEATSVLERLAKLGFADALDAEGLIELFQRHGGSIGVEPRRILDRMEWIARQRDHTFRRMACLRVASVYSKILWSLFCAESKADPVAAPALAGPLLERAERLDQETPGAVLRLLLRLLLLIVTDRPRDALDPLTHKLSTDTGPGRLFSYIATWAGRQGPRNAAYRYALRHAWVDLDAMGLPEDDANVRYSVLSLTLGSTEEQSLLDSGGEALSILSATWHFRPESKHEERLQHWAKLLETQGPLIWNEEFMAVEQQGEIYDGAAPEALLLRTSPHVLEEWAPKLASLQGVHDGRAYEILTRLAVESQSTELRRRYARLAAVAPWRLVRENPTIVASWGWQTRRIMSFFPSSLGDLCELLSEPLPEELRRLLGEKSLIAVYGERVSEGVWASRGDATLLALQASEIPGLLSMITSHGLLVNESYPQFVEESLGRLLEPQNHPAARLAGDILFLRLSAARKPYVRLARGDSDLRRLLPERLYQVLQAACEQPQSTPDKTTLAECEAGLLRLCGRVVMELASPEPLPLNVGLWLNYRLYQWLCAQLEALSPDARHAALLELRQLAPPAMESPAPPADLLHPAGFSPERFDYRLATVLYAISLMEELQRSTPATEGEVQEPLQAVSSGKLEDLLLQLAARPLTEYEQRLRTQEWKLSCLGWEGLGAVPDLALKALLEMNDEALLRMPTKQRLRWLRELPRSPQDIGRLHWRVAPLVWNSFLRVTTQLSAEEKRTLEQYLRELDLPAAPEAKATHWLGLTTLYMAGLRHLEEEVHTLLLGNLGQAQAPKAFGIYLMGLSTHAPERLEAEAESTLAQVEQAGLDPVPFAEGVGRVVVFGSRGSAATARALLRKLASRPPFQGHERMSWLLGTLGIR
jgi:hypothetical protein